MYKMNINNMNNFKKNWLKSLSFLDNCMVNWTIVIILLLYCSTIFNNINSFVGNLYNFSIIKIIILLLIVYVAPKDTTIAVLLALSYIISIFYMANNENFYSSSNLLNEKDNFEDNKYADKNFVGSNFILEKNSDRLMKYDKNNIESFSTKIPNSMPSMPSKMEKKGGFKNINTEHFFPLQKFDFTEDSIINSNNNVNNNVNQNILNDASCLQTYVPVNEKIGDVCNPTSTFKNEFNAQGLNYPEGFNHNVNGSPIDI